MASVSNLGIDKWTLRDIAHAIHEELEKTCIISFSTVVDGWLLCLSS